MSDTWSTRIGRRRFLEGGAALAGATMLAPAVPRHGRGVTARRAGDFVDSIGVNTHLSYLDTVYADYDGIIKPRLREAGISHIRDGSRPDNAPFFAKLRDLAGSGVTTDLIVSPDAYPPNQAATTLRSLRGVVTTIEGPNEPDNAPFSYGGHTVAPGTGDFRAAVAYQRDLYSAVKSHGSTRHVPVLVFSRGDPFIYNAEIGDISAYLDYGNMHSYSGGQEPTGSTNSLADYISAERIMCPTKPLMATETGYYTAPTAGDTWQPGVSELAQGKYIPRVYLEYFLAGVRNTWIYEFIDEGTDQTKSEQNYGLLRNDGSPKPSFDVVKNLITLLADSPARFRPTALDITFAGDAANLHFALLQKSTRDFYLVAWLAVSSFDTTTQADIDTVQQVTLHIREPVRRATTYQPEESAEPVAHYRNPRAIALNVTDRPIVVRLQRG